MRPNTFFLTVIGKDRPGIIAEVTRILFRHGCNLEDVSMTVLEGEFAMILVGCLNFKGQAAGIRKDFSQLEKKSALAFFWKDVQGKLLRGERHAKASEAYLISAAGRDQTGIVHKISRLLGRHRLNITDLNSRILGRGTRSVYSMLLEVDIPRRFPIPKLESELARLARQLHLDLRLKPVERIEF